MYSFNHFLDDSDNFLETFKFLILFSTFTLFGNKVLEELLEGLFYFYKSFCAANYLFFSIKLVFDCCY